jgi:hypothetical protein
MNSADPMAPQAAGPPFGDTPTHPITYEHIGYNETWMELIWRGAG